jgi:hypothetical protein
MEEVPNGCKEYGTASQQFQLTGRKLPGADVR